MAMIWKDGQAVEATADDQLPAAPTSADLDVKAQQTADRMFDEDTKMKALGMVIADVIAKSFNISTTEARQQVKSRFLNYYRSLIG